GRSCRRREAGQGGRVHEEGADRSGGAGVGGRAAIPERASARADEPDRKGSSGEREGDSGSHRATSRREIRKRVRIDGWRGVLLVPEYQRQPASRRRRRVEQVEQPDQGATGPAAK